MATLPHSAHGDILPAVKISPKYEGTGDAKHIVGTTIETMLPFDSCAHVPVTIRGLDAFSLPSPEIIADHNLKLDFLKARFSNLVITFSGGDYGSIRYKGTASGVEFLPSGK